MSKTDEALTDVRRWLCDNLSDGEAGKVCGMLSVVSRHINEIEAENEKLREKYYEYESKMDGLVYRLTGGLLSKSAATPNDALYSATMEQMTDELIGENCKLAADNAKLRELIKDMWRDIPKSEACAWDSSANTCIGSDSCIGECSYWYRMVKLGIEAGE